MARRCRRARLSGVVRPGRARASGGDWIDLASPSLYGATPIERFELIATGDQIRLHRIEMAPEPAPASAAGVIALLALAARRAKSAASA